MTTPMAWIYLPKGTCREDRRPHSSKWPIPRRERLGPRGGRIMDYKTNSIGSSEPTPGNGGARCQQRGWIPRSNHTVHLDPGH